MRAPPVQRDIHNMAGDKLGIWTYSRLVAAPFELAARRMQWVIQPPARLDTYRMKSDYPFSRIIDEHRETDE